MAQTALVSVSCGSVIQHAVRQVVEHIHDKSA